MPQSEITDYSCNNLPDSDTDANSFKSTFSNLYRILNSTFPVILAFQNVLYCVCLLNHVYFCISISVEAVSYLPSAFYLLFSSDTCRHCLPIFTYRDFWLRVVLQIYIVHGHLFYSTVFFPVFIHNFLDRFWGIFCQKRKFLLFLIVTVTQVN